MRNNFINNFQLDPSADDDSGGGLVDILNSATSGAANVITALKGNTKAVSYSGNLGLGPSSKSVAGTGNNNVIYILIALAAIVGLYIFLKK